MSLEQLGNAPLWSKLAEWGLIIVSGTWLHFNQSHYGGKASQQARHRTTRQGSVMENSAGDMCPMPWGGRQKDGQNARERLRKWSRHWARGSQLGQWWALKSDCYSILHSVCGSITIPLSLIEYFLSLADDCVKGGIILIFSFVLLICSEKTVLVNIFWSLLQQERKGTKLVLTSKLCVMSSV